MNMNSSSYVAIHKGQAINLEFVHQFRIKSKTELAGAGLAD